MCFKYLGEWYSCTLVKNLAVREEQKRTFQKGQQHDQSDDGLPKKGYRKGWRRSTAEIIPDKDTGGQNVKKLDGLRNQTDVLLCTFSSQVSVAGTEWKEYELQNQNHHGFEFCPTVYLVNKSLSSPLLMIHVKEMYKWINVQDEEVCLLQCPAKCLNHVMCTKM